MISLAYILVRQLRARWRSWALLAVLVGLAGAVVLTAAAGARRTESAYGRFLETSRAADVLVSPDNTGVGGYYRALAKLPGVETVAPVIGVQALPFRPGPKLIEAQVYAPADRRYGNLIERPRVISGRLPNPARVHEVALDLQAAHQFHVGVGGSTSHRRGRIGSARPALGPRCAAGQDRSHGTPRFGERGMRGVLGPRWVQHWRPASRRPGSVSPPSPEQKIDDAGRPEDQIGAVL